MFRFKLRTLLIAIALVAVPMYLQVHVQNKAKRFVREMREQAQTIVSLEDYADTARIKPPSISDIILFQRRCDVYLGTYKVAGNESITSAFEVYRVSCFGETRKLDGGIWGPQLSN